MKKIITLLILLSSVCSCTKQREETLPINFNKYEIHINHEAQEIDLFAKRNFMLSGASGSASRELSQRKCVCIGPWFKVVGPGSNGTSKTLQIKVDENDSDTTRILTVYVIRKERDEQLRVYQEGRSIN